MTKEEEIKAIEIDLKNIFKKDFIPYFLVKKANNLLERWKILTGWKEDPTPAIYEETFLDKTPYYQFNETRRH